MAKITIAIEEIPGSFPQVQVLVDGEQQGFIQKLKLKVKAEDLDPVVEIHVPFHKLEETTQTFKDLPFCKVMRNRPGDPF